MSKLCIDLPPFAPDYSGAASALFDMGALIAIHDASGCTGNYTGFDEPRWFGSDSMIFCSGLRHLDAVMGSDDIFIQKIVRASESLKPKFIVVLGSPVPMIIGTDLKGIAQEVETITGIPALGLETTGLKYYGKGISEITIALFKKFVKVKKDKIPNTINIIGVSPLDFYINSNDRDFTKLFENNSIKVKASYYMGLSLEDMLESVSASLNLVLSQSGIAVAEYMQANFAIPYIVVTPMGDGSIALRQVQKALNGEYENYIPQTKDAEMIIVGEQVISNSIRQYLQEKHKCKPIVVATLYDLNKEQQTQGDIDVKNELQLRQLLNSGQYKTVIADPMVKQLIVDQSINFYDFAHVALSSKLHWHECKRLLSSDTEKWLKSISSIPLGIANKIL